MTSILTSVSAAPRLPSPVVIVFINASTAVTDDQARAMMATANTWISLHLTPAWGVQAHLVWAPKDAPIPPGAYGMVLHDDADTSGVLGYHTRSATGQPIGRVFVRTDLQAKLSPTVTLTHELGEILVNPDADECVFLQDTDTTGLLVPKEIADPVEADEMGVMVGGTLCSNIILPAWLDPDAKGGPGTFDIGGKLTAPLTLGKGGYASMFRVAPDTKGWTDTFGEGGPSARYIAHDKGGAGAKAKSRAMPSLAAQASNG